VEFKVLTSSPEDMSEWSACIGRLHDREKDVHFLPQYLNIYEKTYVYIPCLAYFGEDDNYIVQPFVKRLLNNLPFLKGRSLEPFYDIANAYGYGGPLCRSDDPAKISSLFKDFDSHFRAYCFQKRIAAEFTSLHPLSASQKSLIDTGLLPAKLQKEVIYIDLTIPETEMWKGVRKGHKSSIKKAEKNAVRIEKAEPTSVNFDALNRLYFDTMKRNKASERWFFPAEYFRNCFEQLGESRVSLFFAYVGEGLAAASILLHDFDTVYYHFSGSDERFYSYCTNNLMVYEIAKWSRRQGYRCFYLGGGVTSSIHDPLYIFKSGFSDRRADLHTYGRIHHAATYEQLCTLKKDYERSVFGNNIESDYFPLYRR
jgi:hypothetical protein